MCSPMPGDSRRRAGERGWGLHVTGGVWIATHLWQHYQFTGDREFLARRAYPVLKGAAEFFLAYLARDPVSGLLYPGPSVSPERGGETSLGPTHDRAMVYELFSACIEASRVLGVDEEFRARLGGGPSHAAAVSDRPQRPIAGVGTGRRRPDEPSAHQPPGRPVPLGPDHAADDPGPGQGGVEVLGTADGPQGLGGRGVEPGQRRSTTMLASSTATRPRRA